MIELIEQFENETELHATWSNGGMGGYTKEYTEWLEQKIATLFVIPLVMESVCDIASPKHCYYSNKFGCYKCNATRTQTVL